MTPTFHHRKPSKRELRRALTLKNAAEQIGHLTPGCELFGISKTFSLIDSVQHLLNEIGPSHVTLSTWSAANSDLGHALALLRNGAILSLKFVIDFSFPSRQPSYCAALRQRFGDASIRVCKNHAKFCLLRNDRWAVTLLTSANLNENLRLESYQISDDAALADYLETIVSDLFDFQQPGEGFTKKPSQIMKDFARFGESDAKIDEATIMASTDARKYFSDKPYANDLDRTGLRRGR